MVIGAQKYVNRVVVCDDGSNDMTAVIAERLGAQVISHERNAGKGQALRSLFLACQQMKADFMVTLDGDGQHDPKDIPKLLEPLEQDIADVMVGARFGDGVNSVPGYRRVGNKMLNAVTNVDISDTQSGFRGYNSKAIMSLLPAEMGMAADSELLKDAARIGLRIGETQISVKYGIGKTSTHNPLYITMDVFLGVVKMVSIRHPLLFYGVPGLALIVSGIYFAVHSLQLFTQSQVINNLVMTYELLGFSLTLFGLLVFFTGVILFTLTTVVRRRETGTI